VSKRTHATKEKTRPTEKVEEVVEDGGIGAAIIDEIDAWLDEIDDVLEECNAAEFVKNYVQKGGQ
jgi:ubiquitin-like protein Pup